MLAKLLENGSASAGRYEQSVLSLMVPGELQGRIRATGTPISTLSMRAGVPSPRAAGRLIHLARKTAPDMVMGWMHHGSIAAWYAARALHPHRPIIWNVRRSLTDISHEKLLTRFLLHRTARLSSQVDAIIFNSHVARQQYIALGYANDHITVIPNGFDCEYFKPRPEARERLTQLFGIDGSRPIIGMIARYHPMKDPATLVEAVCRLRLEGPDAHLLVVGTGMNHLARHIGPALANSLPSDRLTLADQRFDVAEWLPGLDLLVLPSAWGEGFPNILGEAMASGVPCVATDIGNSAWVVGEAGTIVPPRDPEAMRAAMAAILSLSTDARRTLGMSGRARIEEQFSIGSVAGQYVALYDNVWDRSRLGPGLGAMNGNRYAAE